MANVLGTIGESVIRCLPSGESMALKSVWQNQATLVVFFRRWGCMFCRLWAKELNQIAPVLKKHNIRLVGVGVEETGSKEFIDGKYFDGELFYVEDISTYHKLGFKRYNVITILTSLLWKQSREAISKGRSMGLGGDLNGDWVQTGGALLVDKEGKLLHHFVQSGPAEHMQNEEILKLFGLENEYNAETMANKQVDAKQCTTEQKP